MNRKRICVIRQSTYFGDMSVQREVLTLVDAGHDVHVICMDAIEPEDQHPREAYVDGVYVHRMPTTRKKRGVLRYMYDYGAFFACATWKISQLHLQQPFDAIQVNTMPDFLVFVTLLPKLMGAKIVVMMQEPVPELWYTMRGTPAPSPIILAEQGALAYADRVLTVTEQLKQAYISRGANGDKISVMLNVPETRFLESNSANFEGFENPQSLSQKPFTLVCHGAIEERYGHDTMLQALALVRDQIPHVRLQISGAGQFEALFKQMILDLGLSDQVDFLGWVSFERMLQMLHGADVGIVAQKSSPYSNLVHTNKMYEYIFLNKPILASRLASVAAYFDDNSLEFFEPNDPQSLAQGILRLYHQPERRQTLVQNALERYAEYQWGTQKEIYLSVYRNL